jgi:hypothetical protein
MTPMQRSIAFLRSQGWATWRVEHWNSFARIRQDLFGFADILAIKQDSSILVQTTSAANVSARVHKIQELALAKLWLKSPTRGIYVHGWRRPAGSRAWVPRVVPLMLVNGNIIPAEPV